MDLLFNNIETMLFQFFCGSTKTVRVSFQLYKNDCVIFIQQYDFLFSFELYVAVKSLLFRIKLVFICPQNLHFVALFGVMCVRLVLNIIHIVTPCLMGMPSKASSNMASGRKG